MDKQGFYQITHHSLHESILPPKLHTKGKGIYFVFWWRSIALGELFIKPNELESEAKYLYLLIEAIKPSIEFYLPYKAATTSWEEFLYPNDIHNWLKFMEPIVEVKAQEAVPSKVPISVIVCTRDRSSQLKKCLTNLQTLTALPSEIIVVDNAPSDDSSKQVVQFFENVTYIRELRPGLDIARNTGIKTAQFPIIGFVDDDVLVHHLWAYQVWETFKNPQIAAMTGLVIASELETEAQYLFESHWSFNKGYRDKHYELDFLKKNLRLGPPVWEIGAGANMAFRKSVFDRVGFFDKILDAGAAGCNGDSEMWFRILASGLVIHYNPRAVVFHEHRKELSSLKKQIFFYMRGFTTAALLQQQQQPSAKYTRYLFLVLPKYYLHLLIKGFPKFRGRSSTLWPEIKGIISGYLFYIGNKRHSSTAHN